MLHKDVVELVARIPSKFKITTNKTKIILKDTFRDLIPRELFNTSKKGFGVPIGDWFKKELNGELQQIINQSDSIFRGLFNKSFIDKIFEEHMNETVNRSSELWTLFILAKFIQANF